MVTMSYKVDHPSLDLSGWRRASSVHHAAGPPAGGPASVSAADIARIR